MPGRGVVVTQLRPITINSSSFPHLSLHGKGVEWQDKHTLVIHSVDGAHRSVRRRFVINAHTEEEHRMLNEIAYALRPIVLNNGQYVNVRTVASRDGKGKELSAIGTATTDSGTFLTYSVRASAVRVEVEPKHPKRRLSSALDMLAEAQTPKLRDTTMRYRPQLDGFPEDEEAELEDTGEIAAAAHRARRP